MIRVADFFGKNANMRLFTLVSVWLTVGLDSGRKEAVHGAAPVRKALEGPNTSHDEASYKEFALGQGRKVLIDQSMFIEKKNIGELGGNEDYTMKGCRRIRTSTKVHRGHPKWQSHIMT